MRNSPSQHNIQLITMPVVSRFYGIVIKMFFSEHGVPHFHAVYGEHVGELNKAQLRSMWDSKNFNPLPGLN